MVRLNNLFADANAELDATLTDARGRRERFLVNLARHRRENDQLFPSDRTLADRVRDLATDVYGTSLPDDDKCALIEFLKKLRPGDIKKEPLQRAYPVS
jgi:hypothetical protein